MTRIPVVIPSRKPQGCGETKSQLDQSIRVAEGYSELGLFLDAWQELEVLPQALRGEESVLAFRISLLQKFERWKYARELAEALAKNFPGNPRWWLAWSCSLRFENSVRSARMVLEEAVEILPNVALIHYNLACFAAVEGDSENSARFLKSAIRLDGELEKMASVDPDLKNVSISIL